MLLYASWLAAIEADNLAAIITFGGNEARGHAEGLTGFAERGQCNRAKRQDPGRLNRAATIPANLSSTHPAQPACARCAAR